MILKNLFMSEAHELRSTLPELVGYENEFDNSYDLNGYDGHWDLDIITEEIFKNEENESIIYEFTHERWVDAFARTVTLNEDGSIKVYTKSFAVNEYSDQDTGEFLFTLEQDGGIISIEERVNDERVDKYEDKYKGEEYARLHLAGDIVRITRIIDALMKDIRAVEKYLKETK